MSSQSQRDAWSWHKAILLDKPLSWCSSFRQIFNLAIANTSKNLKGHWSAPAAARQTRVCGLQPGREYSLGVAARGQLALSLTTKVVVFTDHYAPPPPSPLVVRHTPKFARRSEIISGLYPTLPLTFFVKSSQKIYVDNYRVRYLSEWMSTSNNLCRLMNFILCLEYFFERRWELKCPQIEASVNVRPGTSIKW